MTYIELLYAGNLKYYYDVRRFALGFVSVRDKVITALFLFFVGGLVVAAMFSSASGWWLAFPIVLAAIVLVLCTVILTSPVIVIVKETPEELQEMENWLFSEGYRPYHGEVNFAHEMVIFRLGEEKKAYPVPSHISGTHENYKYWDNESYRIVRSSKATYATNKFYVKM